MENRFRTLHILNSIMIQENNPEFFQGKSSIYTYIHKYFNHLSAFEPYLLVSTSLSKNRESHSFVHPTSFGGIPLRHRFSRIDMVAKCSCFEKYPRENPENGNKLYVDENKLYKLEVFQIT